MEIKKTLVWQFRISGVVDVYLWAAAGCWLLLLCGADVWMVRCWLQEMGRVGGGFKTWVWTEGKVNRKHILCSK